MNAEKEERDKEFFKQKRADEEAEKLKKLNSMSEEDKETLLREEEAKKEHEAAKSRAAIKTRAAYGSGAAKNIGGGRGGRSSSLPRHSCPTRCAARRLWSAPPAPPLA